MSLSAVSGSQPHESTCYYQTIPGHTNYQLLCTVCGIVTTVTLSLSLSLFSPFFLFSPHLHLHLHPSSLYLSPHSFHSVHSFSLHFFFPSFTVTAITAFPIPFVLSLSPSHCARPTTTPSPRPYIPLLLPPCNCCVTWVTTGSPAKSTLSLLFFVCVCQHNKNKKTRNEKKRNQTKTTC